MGSEMLSGSAPLYGRRTATIDPEPPSVTDARRFFPVYDPETAIAARSIYDGTPYSLQTIDPDRPLGPNVRQAILSERGLLYSVPSFCSGLTSDGQTRISASSGRSLTGVEDRTRPQAWPVSDRSHPARICRSFAASVSLNATLP